ncbi:MAG: iron ABC transporter permease, partial [Campylobacter sp.]
MSKKAFAFLALLLALCVAGSMLLGKYGFSASDYINYVTAL